MLKLSIYENEWNDLVFEGRNKEYGAYQLRRENPKTTVKALLISLAFVASLFTIPFIVNYFAGTKQLPTIANIDGPLTIVDVVYPPPPKIKKEIIPVTKSEKPKTDLGKITVAKKEDAKTDVPKNTDLPATTPSDTGTGKPGNTESTTSGGGGTKTPEAENPPVDNGPLKPFELDKNPEFPGGINAFLTYVGKNFKTPEVDLEKTVKVYVSFIVEKDGSMTNIEVKRDPGYGMGEEAIRVLKSLKTKWEPGRKDGQKVRAYYNLPITVLMK